MEYTEHEKDKDKVLVPVKCPGTIQEEEVADRVDEVEVYQMPRRWRVY